MNVRRTRKPASHSVTISRDHRLAQC